MKKPKKDPLVVELKNGRLSIRIGLDTLFGACAEALDGLVVTDPSTFSKEVLHALKDEEEDGTTLVHRMLDDAIRNAIEQGAEGIEDPYSDD